MAQVLMRRTIGGLTAEAEGEAVTVLQRIPIGSAVVADIRDPRRRSSAYERWFFCLLNKVWANQDYYKTVTNLRHALLIKLGYVDRYEFRDRTVLTFPKSMQWHKMGREDAEKFMNDAVKFMCSEIIPGMDENDLRREIDEMIGPSR